VTIRSASDAWSRAIVESNRPKPSCVDMRGAAGFSNRSGTSTRGAS
jgi:hypothetical protein